ncbi:FixH family protein [Shewanella sp. JM162201]|uniref:FixH family protein n=1 Tax=Shewanella jiangmenensis TaxID=2837387 RepID=A0ABS5V638_9GAMM|nr:FixH family protein [Shewanella jiangmenensis]MBT1445911.1 FixH family protein [Shewanella jiangmenensis]
MSEQQAWYKQFWPWFLIILPLCAVVASLTTFKIALDNSDSLVAEEYYKKGKAINMDLSKIQFARQIGMQFLVSVENGAVIIEQHGGPAYEAGLNTQFYHPTLADRDFSQMLSRDATGKYRITPEAPISGDWEIRIESFDGKWRLQKRLELVEGKQHWLN